jgi:hypothetical protein
MFPITSPENGNVGQGPRDLSEFGFKVDEKFAAAEKNRQGNCGKK